MSRHRTRFMISEPERAMQHAAIDPEASVWVTANAGSGKTTILTRRVVRMLLAGVDPARILCLTYTKAAAAEMQNRVFDLLGGWVRLEDRSLDAAIEELEGRAPDRRRRDAARRLFAKALETPGGLKIQTIHAFCERLLHLFPFEANVPARFRMLDDAEAAFLLERCIAGVETGLTEADPAGQRFAEALKLVAREAGAEQFALTLRQAMAAAEGLVRGHGGGEDTETLLREALGLKPGETSLSVDEETLAGALALAEWPRAVAALRALPKTTDQKLGEALAGILALRDTGSRARAYRALFFTKDRTTKADKLKERLGTKDQPSWLAEALDADKARMEALAERWKAARALERTQALAILTERAVELYAGEKRRRGALDFTDLISRTANLLQRVDARWILYKLDSGLEHLLVDEAQDTSPEQWRILAELTADFFAGKGQARGIRTVFAVGDEKQSIYSFQGAAPRQFQLQHATFKKRVEDSENRFSPVRLRLSFRTGKDILSAVDAVFQGHRYQGLGAPEDDATVHETARAGQPGLVEIWPIEEPEQAAEEDETAPVDALPPRASEVMLAERIADRIAFWLRNRTCFEDDGTPIRPGDVMILVRQRKALFECIIRALKRRRVPVAGADRLDLTAHIAVRDLLALGEIALMPEDDLSLAIVLKSPLIGFDDDDLITLAGDRGLTSLYAALGRAAEREPRFASAHDRIAAWRAAAGGLPFDFYARVLGPEGGRAALIARLGPDSTEVIDVFLADVLAWQRENPPSLVGFLHFMRHTERVVKRELEAGGNAVRVMTVHASKGLEARIVILPDTIGTQHPSQEPKLYTLPAPGTAARIAPEPGLTVWSPSRALDPIPVAAERRRARQDALEEGRRLLYVAMTRARDRLYIAAFGRKRMPAGEHWYGLVQPVLSAHGFAREVEAEDDASRKVWQWRCIDAAPASPLPADAAEPDAPTLPDWLTRTPAPEAPVQPPLRPSTLQAAADRRPAVRGAGERQRRGVLIHALLERLPPIEPEARPEAAARWLANRAPMLGHAERQAMIGEALQVLADPSASALFGANSRAEVEVAGEVSIAGVLTPVSGRIDRIAVLEDRVLISDYKTGAIAPGAARIIPDAYLMQLAIYRALLGSIYPGRTINAGIVWTALPVLVFAEAERLDAVLA